MIFFLLQICGLWGLSDVETLMKESSEKGAKEKKIRGHAY